MKKFYVYSIEEIEVDNEKLIQRTDSVEFDNYKDAIKYFLKLRKSSEYQVIGHNYVSKHGRMQRDIIKSLSSGEFEIMGIKDLPICNELEELVDYFM
ncbi:MAG: hypothetical protein B6I28_06410 [Fusobacteriia bacterium 4572_132]|nr:MAG: hypothetical protein B6I28_06410 [Fusobacteriia bacterium 4572_132]